MQQYRVNYPLLIGLLVGTLVCSGAVYGLWRFQLGRSAGALRADAEKALEEGDYRRAVRYYANYVSIRNRDDEARVKLADAYADLTEQDDVRIEEYSQALTVLESTVRRLPDATALRRRLAEFYFRMGRYQDALDHLGYLLDKEPDNVELKVLQSQYLDRSGNFDEAIKQSFILVGYDADSDTFDAKKATAPDAVDVYARLAVDLRKQRDKSELADRVMEQLIEANPDSAAAHLKRGQYLIGIQEEEAGEAEIQKAYELAPQDADVLLNVADRKSQNKEYDPARELLETGKKLYPDNIGFYQALARLDSQQQKYDEALAEVNEGLEAVAGAKARVLLLFKSELQSRAGDVEGMRQTVDDMRKAKFAPAYVELTEAQILLTEHKWFEASEALNRLRPRVSGIPGLGNQIDYQLGLCYERLGQYELALNAYNLVLQSNPQNDPAIAGRQRVLGRIHPDEPTDDQAEQTWQRLLADELRKPKDERDWSQIDKAVDDAAEQGELKGVNVVLLKANLKLAQEDFAAARQLLKQANTMDPDNLQAYRLLIRTARFDPEQGPERALRMLNAVVKKFGDLPELRMDEADLHIAIHDDQLTEELSELAEPKDGWSDDQKAALWAGLAARYANLGMNDQARLSWSRVADVRPNNLPTRLTLFNLALEAQDDAGMEAAQSKILDIVQDKQDSTWLYTEARRLLSLVRRGKLPQEKTSEIRELVNHAMEQRPDWAELNLVQAELDLLNGNVEKALVEYDRAEELGRLPTQATVQHIRLLALREQFERAKELVDRLPPESRRRLLGAAYSEILLRTNDVDAAVDEARAIVDADPTSAANQLWYGQFLGRAMQLPSVTDSQREKYLQAATAAVEQAVKLEPQLVDGWYLLLSFHVIQKQREQALEVLRDAQLTLSGDLLPQFLAKSYEVLGYWFDAENLLRLQHENEPDNTARARQLAAFYLGRVYQLQDGAIKASPLINEILRAGAEGKIPTSDPDLQWARRQGAELLAAQNDYQQLLKAEKLLASNSQDGFLSVQDQLQMAHILASRPEPGSRLKATQLFEAVGARQSLDAASELMLGRLYYALGDWSKCRRQMQQTIGRFPKLTLPRDAYVRMLLEHGERRDFTDAIPQVAQLRQLAPGHPRVIELSVRLANKLGKQQEARTELLRLLPPVSRSSDVTDEQIPALETVARLLVEVEDLDDAEKIYRLLAPRDSKHAVDLAVFLGEHRDVDQCFEQLDKVYSADHQLRPIIQAAGVVVRERRDEVGDKYDQQIQTWLDRGLRENPDSISMMMLQGDFYDVQQKYNEAAALYRKLLAKNDLVGVQRAIVLNNLAYLMALSGGDPASADEALKLVQEAAQILGPTADILDTRAVTYIAKGDYQKAIQDMELAVLDTPSPAKYFHTALAHLRAGQNKEALEAWDKADELAKADGRESIRDSLNRIEYDRYDDTKAKIDELRNSGGLLRGA